jgi:hypothetical protein
LFVLAVYSGIFVYNRIWDKLITACEGVKIVGWEIVFGPILFLVVMVAITPFLGGVLAIATGIVSSEVVYGTMLLSWFKLRITNTATKNYK